MKQIRSLTKKIEENSIIYSFNNNRNVKKVIIKFADNFVNYIEKEIIIKYAENNIITDLVFWGNGKIDDKQLEINRESSVSASHIFIILPNSDIVISDVLIYEESDEHDKIYYPAYFDTDLGENYYLDKISVFTSSNGYSQYSVYTSINGRDFELLSEKRDEKSCDFKKGDIYSANGREARIIRVYIEYNSASAEALFDRIEFMGEKSNTEIQNRPVIYIPEFKYTFYNVAITEQDTLNEVYGILERRLGEKYKSWFDFELAENPKCNDLDYFEITERDQKILIKGNSGVSLAVGLNHYLKYYCKVNISQVGDQIRMPENIVPPKDRVFKETKAKVRYAYNYCTLSYTMAFWGEKEWQEELDWLALNGVNVVLDLTAQEEVWRRFLTSIGYTHEEILKFIAGPAYYAWAYMGNLSGFGGPVHDSWFYQRTELARKNHLKMRKLGMYPVLQGYSGIVPNDIDKHDENVDIILQGTWGFFDRPAMLRTTSNVFKEYAKKFYKAQEDVYGCYSKYFATDPFHEGGDIGDMSAREISKEVLTAMLNVKKDAIWIIQSWQRNPTSELLAGLDLVPCGKQHALILDLYAEKDPNYKKGHSENSNHGYSAEFDKTPWVFCMLNNFGGRLGLHGHLDNLSTWIPEAFNNSSYIAGIGITPEASFNNPVLYDFLFESVWKDNTQEKMKEIDLKEWVCNYAERRYGAKSLSAERAWEILINTVYKSEFNNLGQGAPESIINARPALEIKAASTWGNSVISYDKNELRKALSFLLEDYNILKNSEGYKYDLITLSQQILSNLAQDIHNDMSRAYKNKDLDLFKSKSKDLLKVADYMDKVLSGSVYYMLGRWVEQAKSLARNADDFSKKIYEMNAKSLITTWGSYNQGSVRDYSNRQWSGLIRSFYKPRWEIWINEKIDELSDKPHCKNTNWFEHDWNWVRCNEVYNTEVKDLDFPKMVKSILLL